METTVNTMMETTAEEVMTIAKAVNPKVVGMTVGGIGIAAVGGYAIYKWGVPAIKGKVKAIKDKKAKTSEETAESTEEK